MFKKVIIPISIILNVVLIMIIFLPEKNIFFKSNRVEKKYEKTDEGQRLYIETEFDGNNNPTYQKTVIDSKLSEEYIYFENGQIKQENHYKNGKKHGYCIMYDINKNIKKSSRYENGILREILKYYSNGNIKELSIPETSKIRLITTYHKNGLIESEGKMIISKYGNETFYDRWIWYDIDGSIKEEKVFKTKI